MIIEQVRSITKKAKYLSYPITEIEVDLLTMAEEHGLESEMEDAIRDKHKEISFTDTPKYYVKEKQGFDYVDEGYMRHVLNQFYPAWNWEIIKYELLGSEWIAVQGRLTIHDNGINRKYDSISSHRIQKKRGSDEFVDIGNDMKAANSDAFKVAVNRLCNV